MNCKFGILLLTALCLAVPAAEAQQPKKIPRIGYLAVTGSQDREEEFRKGLRELGYVEGQSVHIEYRFAQGRAERLAGLAAGLVELKVDVIVASGTQAIDAARQATRTIPIVFPNHPDPVESGHVASVARPGGNLTGLSSLNRVVAAKRMELLNEVMPSLSRVAVLWNPGNPGSTSQLKEMERAAKRLGMRVQILQVRSPDDMEAALQAAISERAGALLLTGDSVLRSQWSRVLDFGAKHRLPVVVGGREPVEAGALMSYGTSFPAMYRRSAAYVDKILKGAKPGDLPVEQPTKFELVLNLKAARALGLAIPQSILLRADQVIE